MGKSDMIYDRPSEAACILLFFTRVTVLSHTSDMGKKKESVLADTFLLS